MVPTHQIHTAVCFAQDKEVRDTEGASYCHTVLQ